MRTLGMRLCGRVGQKSGRIVSTDLANWVEENLLDDLTNSSSSQILGTREWAGSVIWQACVGIDSVKQAGNQF